MIDVEHLAEWPISNVLTARGFTCDSCETREAVSYTNVSVREALRKLVQYRPGHRKFQFLFAKILRRMEGTQQRGEAHGALEDPHVASN